MSGGTKGRAISPSIEGQARVHFNMTILPAVRAEAARRAALVGFSLSMYIEQLIRQDLEYERENYKEETKEVLLRAAANLRAASNPRRRS